MEISVRRYLLAPTSTFTACGQWSVETYLLYAGCGGTLLTHSGTFTSPGYPWEQLDSKRCEWTIRGHARHQVVLDFSAFTVGDRRSREHNYVSVYDGDSVVAPLVGTYCGSVSVNKQFFPISSVCGVKLVYYWFTMYHEICNFFYIELLLAGVRFVW